MLTIPNRESNSVYMSPSVSLRWKNASLAKAYNSFTLNCIFKHSEEMANNIQMHIAVAEYSPLINYIYLPFNIYISKASF
jgi:hypothetical protein